MVGFPESGHKYFNWRTVANVGSWYFRSAHFTSAHQASLSCYGLFHQMGRSCPLRDQTATSISTAVIKICWSFGVLDIVHCCAATLRQKMIGNKFCQSWCVHIAQLHTLQLTCHPLNWCSGNHHALFFSKLHTSFLPLHTPVIWKLNFKPCRISEAAVWLLHCFKFFKVGDPVWLSIPTARKHQPHWDGKWVVAKLKGA